MIKILIFSNFFNLKNNFLEANSSELTEMLHRILH